MTSERTTLGVRAIGVEAMQLWSSFIEIPRWLCCPSVRVLCLANDANSVLDWFHVRLNQSSSRYIIHTLHPCPLLDVPRMCQPYSLQHRDLLSLPAWQLHTSTRALIVKPSWVSHAVRR